MAVILATSHRLTCINVAISHQDGELMRQCLRTYSLIDKTAEAEVLFRDSFVRPFLNTVFYTLAIETT